MLHKSETLKRIKLLRRDQSHLLFHFTQTQPEMNAATILERIIETGHITGSTDLIRGSYKCVCFTEAPIAELATLFSLSKIDSKNTIRYEPYGIAVKKDWLFQKGGRPVIYQPDSEFHSLPENLKYRHVRYDPTRGIDFTWEREWRLHADELKLDPGQALVIVPTSHEAFELMYYHSRLEADSCSEDGFVDSVSHVPKWLAISLDFFGFTQEDD